MFDQSSEDSSSSDTEFVRTRIEEYGDKLIGQDLFRFVAVQCLIAYIRVYDGFSSILD